VPIPTIMQTAQGNAPFLALVNPGLQSCSLPKWRYLRPLDLESDGDSDCEPPWRAAYREEDTSWFGKEEDEGILESFFDDTSDEGSDNDNECSFNHLATHRKAKKKEKDI
jgi:hypothetical protein